MSQFDHESKDQSVLANEEVRRFREKIGYTPPPETGEISGASLVNEMRNREHAEMLIAQLAQQQEFQKRRYAYRGPDARRHLQDELYRDIHGAVAQYQAYLERKSPPPLVGLEFEMNRGYFMNPQEHFTRSLHAMIFQEMDLYLEERERELMHELRDGLKELKNSIGE